MTGPIKNYKYQVTKTDIENMVRSNVSGEAVTAKLIVNPAECKERFKAKCTSGWWIRVERKLYGEYYLVDTFIDEELVEHGPDWVEKHHELIDKGFENARLEMSQAKKPN